MDEIAVYRFMSRAELENFQRGEVCGVRRSDVAHFFPISRVTDVPDEGCPCCPPSGKRGDVWGILPCNAWEFLDMVVSPEVCALFSAPKAVFHRQCRQYADPDEWDWDATMDVWELAVLGGYSKARGFRLLGTLDKPAFVDPMKCLRAVEALAGPRPAPPPLPREEWQDECWDPDHQYRIFLSKVNASE